MLFRRREGEDQADGDENDPTTAGESTLSRFDAAASERTLSACAGILSWCDTAILESTRASSPFLTMGQKAAIQSTATNFERRQTLSLGNLLPEAPASSTQAQLPPDFPTREEIEATIEHRVEIAIQDALKNLGVSPDATIDHQVERQVEVQLATQEHRLLEYVKHQLTDSLQMLERTLSNQIAEFAEGRTPEHDREAARAEVEAQVEEARETLLRHIEEVRTVDVGFNIDSFAAELAGMADFGGSAPTEEVEIGGDEEEEIAVVEAEEEEAPEPADETESEPQETVETESPSEASAEAEPEAEVSPEPKAEDEPEASHEPEAEEEASADTVAEAIAEVTAEDEDSEDFEIRPDLAEEDGVAEIDLDGEAAGARVPTEQGITLDLDEDQTVDALTAAEDELKAIQHYLEQGERLVGEGKYRDAIVAYDSCINVSDENAMAYYKRGLALDELGDHRKAFLDLMRARDLDGDLPDIRKLISECRKKVNKAGKSDKKDTKKKKK